MRSLLILLLLTVPAIAAMAPEVYEAARRDAPDVIVIALAGATPPPDGASYGDCTVVGTVERVERGTRYAVGAPIALAVDCAEPDAPYPDGGALYQDMASLLASTYGRAFLGPDGEIVLSQYDQLTLDDLR